MKADKCGLLREWDGRVSSLSIRAKDSRRVSFAIRKTRGSDSVAYFDILVDRRPVFRAYDIRQSGNTHCGLLIAQVSPTHSQLFWLTQMGECPLPTARIVYALSMWYADSYGLVGRPIDITALIAEEVELRKSERWTTLYAKHPLLRVCRGEVVYSRLAGLPAALSHPATRGKLCALYHVLSKTIGNKVQLRPIRMKR